MSRIINDCNKILDDIEMFKIVDNYVLSPNIKKMMCDNKLFMHAFPAVSQLMRIGINPLLRNKSGQLAADVTTDAAIRSDLIAYAGQLPCRQVVRWYGPYLMARLRAWLLVVERPQSSAGCPATLSCSSLDV
jgi:hypothetical protein